MFKNPKKLTEWLSALPEGSSIYKVKDIKDHDHIMEIIVENDIFPENENPEQQPFIGSLKVLGNGVRLDLLLEDENKNYYTVSWTSKNAS